MYLNPEIKIKFVLNNFEEPAFIESGNMKHYKIEISIENIPDDVYAVNYQLDQSYVNPFREEVNKGGSFKFNTTTFGDYSISALLLGKKQNYTTSIAVSKALRKSYINTSNGRIQSAIKDVMDH